MNSIPRAPRVRPDFLAPGPRVRVEDGLAAIEESDEMIVNKDEDDERPQMRYYKSQKTLGLLYRNIDEFKFLAEIRSAGRMKAGSADVLHGVWAYVEKETQGFEWQHLVEGMKVIREMYAPLFRLCQLMGKVNTNEESTLAMRITSTAL